MGTSLRMVRVIDSHTAGQPTRVVVEGGPDLGGGPLKEQRERLKKNFDRFRSAIVGEPRGSDALIGAILCTPSDPSCTAAAIFFDNSGYLEMCGHGVIGLVATLEYLGQIKGDSVHRIETPAGIVTAELHPAGDISLQNVACFRHKKNVALNLKKPESVALVKRLVTEWCDAVAENYAPKAMKGFGLDYDAVRAVRPMDDGFNRGAWF